MKRTAKLFASIFCAFSALASAVSPAWAATTIAVTASKPSGTYDAPISVSLAASDPAAKIWYTFNPKAPPGDALPYSKPLRIDKSTPLLYFAYVDKEHESKIEREDYVIAPVTLRIEDGISIANDAKNVTVVLQNYGPAPVPLAGWTLRTDLESRTFSKSAVSVPAGSKTDFTLPYSEWAVTLTSPDGEIRSTATVLRKAPEPVKIEVPVTEPAKPATVTRPDDGVKIAVKPTEKPAAAQVAEIPSPTEAPSAMPSINENPSSTESAKPAEIAIPPTPEAVLATTENAPSANSDETPDPLAIKASSAESWASDGTKNVAFAALWVLAAGVVIRIWSIAKKRHG